MRPAALLRRAAGGSAAAAALVLLLALAAAPARAQNIVANPGFESASVAPWVIQTPAPNYGWALQTASFNGLVAHAGAHYLSEGCIGTACVPTTGTGTSAISQTLATVPGNTYNLTFWISNVVTGSTPAEFVVEWGGKIVIDLADPTGTVPGQQFLPQNAPGYTQFSVTVTASASSTVLALYGRQDPAYFAIDDVSVAPFVTGKVILDNGAGGGTANDGVLNGGEAGHAGVTVSLTNCAGTTYSTAVTSASGAFSLPTDNVPAGSTGPACVVETLPAGYIAVSSNAGATGGTYTPATQTLKFNFGPTVNVNGIVFGEVPASSFSTDGNQQIAAGQSAIFAHTFVAGDKASVSFAAAGVANPASPAWTSVLYLDTTCSGTLTGSDTVISAPIAVNAGQTVCILDKVTSPAGASTGASEVVTVSAVETYAPTPTNGAIVHTFTHADTATVVASDLALLKQVRVVATCPSTAADTNAFGASNQASPGNYVEYQITYSNASSAPLVNIKIDDTVPAFTLFQTALCGTLPPGESACSVSAPAVGASSGAITWTLTDAAAAPIGLQPGGSGTVRMCVRVAQ